MGFLREIEDMRLTNCIRVKRIDIVDTRCSELTVE